MNIQAISLQSGSNGNCIYVETDNVRLIFDAGISGIEAERRLRARGKEIRDVDALIISHDHADHAKYAGILHRKYGLPVYMTRETLKAAHATCGLGRLDEVCHFYSGDSLRIGDVVIKTIPTPHDGADGAIFVVEYNGTRIGIMTDLGHVFDELQAEVSRLDAVFIESNYDPEMLAKGPYPVFLQKRIIGPGGHISNFESAELLSGATRLKWACLSHLSQHNNYPSLAVKTHRKIHGHALPLHIAGRICATEILTV
jgi:phosphoribosyl 1,2-cyclic phosphodiesterase